MNKEIKQTAQIGLLLALALVLTAIENLLPLPWGVKLGLANVVIMFALESQGEKVAGFLTLGKSLFGFLTRGVTAFILSGCGGLLALIAMILVRRLLKGSTLLVSITGALGFNLGQLLALICLYQQLDFLYLGLILAVAAAVTGTLTALILQAARPLLGRISS